MWATVRIVAEVLALVALVVVASAGRRHHRALERTREVLAQLAEHTSGLPGTRPLPITVQALIREHHRDRAAAHRLGRADRPRTPE